MGRGPSGKALAAALVLVACGPARKWDASVEARLEAAVDALAQDDPAREWAGVYHGSFLMNCWTKLVVAPDGRFTYHESCCMVTDEREGGSARIDGELLRLDLDRGQAEPGRRFEPPYRLVRWGEARFLVPPEELGAFVSWINGFGHQPLFGRASGFLHRGIDMDALPLRGRPDLPAPWSERLLAEPIEAGCLAIEPGATDGQSGLHSVELLLDAGEADGLWPDMVLWGRTLKGSAVVRSVELHGARAEVRWRRAEEPDDELLGAVFSTRRDW